MTNQNTIRLLRFLNIFFSFRGRLPRLKFWVLGGVIWTVFIILFIFLEKTLGRDFTLLLYPPFFWASGALAVRRYHDLGKSSFWLLLLFVPLAGVAWVVFELGFRRGSRGDNQYGDDPLMNNLDYLTVQ